MKVLILFFSMLLSLNVNAQENRLGEQLDVITNSILNLNGDQRPFFRTGEVPGSSKHCRIDVYSYRSGHINVRIIQYDKLLENNYPENSSSITVIATTEERVKNLTEVTFGENSEGFKVVAGSGYQMALFSYDKDTLKVDLSQKLYGIPFGTWSCVIKR